MPEPQCRVVPALGLIEPRFPVGHRSRVHPKGRMYACLACQKRRSESICLRLLNPWRGSITIQGVSQRRVTEWGRFSSLGATVMVRVSLAGPPRRFGLYAARASVRHPRPVDPHSRRLRPDPLEDRASLSCKEPHRDSRYQLGGVPQKNTQPNATFHDHGAKAQWMLLADFRCRVMRLRCLW